MNLRHERVCRNACKQALLTTTFPAHRTRCDRRPVVTLDFWTFAEIVQRAGMIPTPSHVEAVEDDV